MEIFLNENDDHYRRYRCNHYGKDIANSEQALSFYKTLSKKVYSSKNFLIEFIGVIGFGATSENNPVGANEFAKELFKGMIKYLESTRDFEMLKKIMKSQVEDSNYFTNKASLIYFHISDRLKTPEIKEYFLFLHFGSLDSHSLPRKFDNFDLCLKDQKDFSKALNDEFYFKLVSKHGISYFEIPYMAEKIRHLFDNKEFMINADGKNIMNYLNDNNIKNENLFWRKDKMATVRSGNYKLIRLNDTSTVLYNIKKNYFEDDNIKSKQSKIHDSLLILLSDWEKRLINPNWIENKNWNIVTEMIYQDLMGNKDIRALSPKDLN